ncbi:MAG TPA: hypothetical protein VF916_03200 [Ktedonobacterales bacterium]
MNMLIALRTMSTPLLSLYISLAFGVGQCVIGAALVIRGRAGGRWRRLATFVGAILGAWLVCSGAAELAVSGAEVITRLQSHPDVAASTRVRGMADAALLVASGILAAALALYPLWLRLGSREARHSQLRKDQV